VPTPNSPFDVENVRARVGDALAEFVARKRQSLIEISPDLSEVHLALEQFLQGGKRLRPVFCWWAWRAAGGDDSDAAIRAATSLELLQACALIHDDVMDGSDTRRGAPAVHKRLAARHTELSWVGDPERFGAAGAILLGDLALAWADELFFDSGLSAQALFRAKPVLDIMRTELMAGQYLDVVEQARGQSSVPRALTVARYKSAKYTIERPLHLGAMLNDATPQLLHAFGGYGLPLGEAFQLRDDILGVFGDPATTGKPAGDDLREGKRTVLVAEAFQRADDVQFKLLADGLGRADLSDTDVAQIRAVIVETGALAVAEELISRRLEQALASLETAELAEQPRTVLANLALAATNRRG
jgi:geranylgeranyl diphosphate synthase, type I